VKLAIARRPVVIEDPPIFEVLLNMAISGQTNVLSSCFGSGSADQVAADLGRFVVTSMPLPWQIARDRIGGTPVAVLMVESMEREVVERQVSAAPPCDAVVAIGGGQAIDLGKYLAWRRGVRLVTIPTVISVDAFVTPAAGVRVDHRVEYVGQASPDPLVIDYDLLRTAPASLNIAGAGDLLSIHTATRDWELAEAAGRSTFPYSPADVAAARGILEDVLDGAEQIAKVTDQGLQTLVEGYMRVNTLCLPAGHYRVEEGSEHFLFYELEERLQRPFIHGHIIGLGIYLMSRLQDNDPLGITEGMDRLGLIYQPADLGIDRQTLAASLRNLAAYTEQRGMWYSVIQTRPITEGWIASALSGLRFA
jgi:glycerol-1-phosphate dehydrogenase [NAD(P)+]